MPGLFVLIYLTLCFALLVLFIRCSVAFRKDCYCSFSSFSLLLRDVSCPVGTAARTRSSTTRWSSWCPSSLPTCTCSRCTTPISPCSRMVRGLFEIYISTFIVLVAVLIKRSVFVSRWASLQAGQWEGHGRQSGGQFRPDRV